jgi:BolA protein
LREKIEKKLQEALSTSHVEVVDESHLHEGHAGARDGGGHFRAVIVSDAFEGLSRIQAQQRVFAVMDDWMGKEIHALSMQTFTPEQWADRPADQ